jgi:two-component system, response regulator PdtaR
VSNFRTCFQAAELAKVVANMKKGREHAVGKMLRVLIVEDEAVLSLLLEATIEALGHSICGVSATESDAVAQAELSQPDLMIVDAGLADGNGISAVETITKTRLVPHIFMTGNKARVHALRPDSIILEKPYFTSDLVRAIDQAMAVAAATQA